MTKTWVKRAAVVAVAATALSGCMGSDSATKGGVAGGVIGGVGCALLGGNVAQCLAAGVVLAAVGYGIGSQIDKRDREAYDRAVQQALVQEQDNTDPITETSVETGNTITVTPISTTVAEGRPCREFDMTYIKDGQEIQQPEKWCQRDDGQWEPVKV